MTNKYRKAIAERVSGKYGIAGRKSPYPQPEVRNQDDNYVKRLRIHTAHQNLADKFRNANTRTKYE